ncbi:MAG: hypothetical protein HN909_06870 [Phycisphaerales bacterium]|jgi:hypothetical protein|nr:hypothetical protein [Phycisphaerales bacterium]MBT7171476.1 hypothetical protein [Phycisphaerales bacterium]
MLNAFNVIGLGLTIGDALGAASVDSGGSNSGPANPMAGHDVALARRVDKLTMACMAMWELIRDQTTLTEEDLIAKMREIDLRDGSEDGKLTLRVRNCPACNRPVGPRSDQCLYCGADMPSETAFNKSL